MGIRSSGGGPRGVVVCGYRRSGGGVVFVVFFIFIFFSVELREIDGGHVCFFPNFDSTSMIRSSSSYELPTKMSQAAPVMVKMMDG